MTTKDDRAQAGLRSAEPPPPDLRIGGPKPAPDWITSWVRNCEVRLGHELLGYAWELRDGQWTTWSSGPRFATTEEAAEHLRQQRLAGASLSGPLAGAGVTR
jgi:hypothetical protein